MGRTVPAYRLASEREKRRWKVFRERLYKNESKPFHEMMSYPHLYNVAGVGACKPLLLHPILMPIIEHHKQLNNIQSDNHI
ncbi:MAG TPA: hypothetical protein VJ599_04340 [Nitrososphaeraceae archaeon]|nr:hypothetical protein [Nitrososphaeraceae archaeon]